MKKCLFVFSVFFAILVSAIYSNPEAPSPLLQNDFAKDENIRDWTPYTNDGNQYNGWKVQNGALFQYAANNDEIPGGWRFLIKTKAMKNALPVDISLDVFPYDDAGKGYVCFGLGILGSSREPEKNSIMAAIYENEMDRISGLNIRQGGKWIDPENNLPDTPVNFHWNRIRMRLEKDPGNKVFKVLAKIWGEDEKEPSEWLISKTIPLENIPQPLEDFGLFTGALFGEGGMNPRAWFDNLVIASGSDSSNIFPVKTKADGDVLRKMKLEQYKKELEEYRFGNFSQSNERFIQSCPEFGAELLFYQILALRKDAQWPQSRELANRLEKDLKNTPYGMMMGGPDGRTEEQAAIDFSNGMTAFYDKRYGDCIKIMYEFIDKYPTNWRRKQARYQICHSCYWNRDYPGLYTEAEKFHKEFGLEEDAEQILVLEISSRIHRTEQEKARSLIRDFRNRFPDSPRLGEMDQLEIETYFYGDNMDLTIQDWKNPAKKDLAAKIENDMMNLMYKWASSNHVTWFSKNLDFFYKLYEKTKRREKALALMDEVTMKTIVLSQARREAFQMSLTYLDNLKRYDRMENLLRTMLDYEKDSDQRRSLKNKLADLLRDQKKFEEAKEVFTTYSD